MPFKPNQDRENIDEEFIKKIREEINEVNKISGTIPANKEVILNKDLYTKEFDKKSDSKDGHSGTKINKNGKKSNTERGPVII
jgi:hypothetical protein